jgi:hypothetical protein
LTERALTESEHLLLTSIAANDASFEAAVISQVECLKVVRESPGFLIFAVPADAPRIMRYDGFPINAWYADRDGGLVILLLHVALPEGVLSSLERYRPDGEQIENFEPSLSDVSVMRSPTIGENLRFKIERKDGTFVGSAERSDANE